MGAERNCSFVPQLNRLGHFIPMGFPPVSELLEPVNFQTMSLRLPLVALPTRNTAVPNIHEFETCAGSRAVTGPFGRLLFVWFIRNQRAESDVVLPRCGCAPDRQEL